MKSMLGRKLESKEGSLTLAWGCVQKTGLSSVNINNFTGSGQKHVDSCHLSYDDMEGEGGSDVSDDIMHPGESWTQVLSSSSLLWSTQTQELDSSTEQSMTKEKKKQMEDENIGDRRMELRENHDVIRLETNPENRKKNITNCTRRLMITGV
ncbi:uncharacterized protein V6R79_005368 [Siganus canaliculatus]